MGLSSSVLSNISDQIGVDRLLERMLAISTVGIIFFDPDGDIIEANEAFLSITGFTREDVAARRLRWDTLTPPEWMGPSLDAIRQLLTLGSTTPYEKEYFRKDGTRFRGLFAAKGLADHRGVEFILDITEKHRVQQSLKESEERFRQLSDSSPIGVFQADLDGNITYANLKAEEIFGMRAPELLGRGWLSRLCPEDADVVAKRWADALQQDRSYQVEYRLQMPDGEIRSIRAQSVMLHGANGKAFGVVGTVEDITSRKRAEATLRETEKLAAVGRLASSIAHEINNPLESVTNLLFLARSTRDIDEVQRYLATAEQELRRVSAISSQTLRFHKQSTKPSQLPVQKLFDEIVSIHRGRLLNSHIDVHTRCGSDASILCFEGEIRQVLNNLLGNSIDAMHPGGGRLFLRCRNGTNWTQQCRGVVITVADTGTGIPETVRKKIFDAFFTTKGINGTGLGLWISKDIVARHHGMMRVRSTAREARSGSVFRLFLPFDAVGGGPREPAMMSDSAGATQE